jgi:hypothetical protein
MHTISALVQAAGETIDLGSALTTAGAAVTTQVGSALPVALPIAGAILAVGVGWRIFRRFVKG